MDFYININIYIYICYLAKIHFLSSKPGSLLTFKTCTYTIDYSLTHPKYKLFGHKIDIVVIVEEINCKIWMYDVC